MGKHTRKDEVRLVNARLDGEARRILYGGIVAIAGLILGGLKGKGYIDGSLELSLINVTESFAELTLLLGLTYARSKVGILVDAVKPFVEPILPPDADDVGGVDASH